MKNKISALVLFAVGGLAIMLDHDATFMALAVLVGVPLFFSKRNWIM